MFNSILATAALLASSSYALELETKYSAKPNANTYCTQEEAEGEPKVVKMMDCYPFVCNEYSNTFYWDCPSPGEVIDYVPLSKWDEWDPDTNPAGVTCLTDPAGSMLC